METIDIVLLIVMGVPSLIFLITGIIHDVKKREYARIIIISFLATFFLLCWFISGTPFGKEISEILDFGNDLIKPLLLGFLSSLVIVGLPHTFYELRLSKKYRNSGEEYPKSIANTHFKTAFIFFIIIAIILTIVYYNTMHK